MTDEELLIWLRVEDTNLTDFAADRIEELIAARDTMGNLWAKEAAERNVLAGRCEELEAKLEEFRHALLWCSGSADFNEGGFAREGWLKVCAPLLKGDTP